MNFSLKVPPTYALHARLSLGFFTVQTLTRVILLLKTSLSVTTIPKLMFVGFVWDLMAWTFLGLPLFLASSVIPKRFSDFIDKSIASKLFVGTLICVLSFVGFCELTFWDEFRSRFNFIAVDYLVYTNEVVANINESFPMPLIFSGVIAFSGFLTLILYRIRIVPLQDSLIKKVPAVILLSVVLPLVLATAISPLLENFESNFRKDQITRNGWLEFYRAFRSNSIDYNTFYATISPEKAKATVISKKVPAGIPAHLIDTKPNVVMIVVESLGAKFISTLGGQKTTTPFLNKLSSDSMFFENLYATGTRTVRGLEAINLSVPPTPGYAVVKRPVHKNLYSLGNSFKRNGYDPVFLYGGRGFFDNMNSFFEGNGFRTIDQSDFKDKEVTFSNAWGVCDEDLFNKALQVMDSKNSLVPKLLFLLTTSNHRPFTYPSGKIDIPSGESRIGAVKYTDFAIGKFIRDSQKRPWSKNTIFVIVADHSTEGRGRFDLEMSDYHIPMWIYSPGLIKHQRISKLVSQIDLLPSLIHLLGLKDSSPFLGESFFSKHQSDERAFIGNYQYVGYYKNKILTTLGPNQKVRSYNYDPFTKKQKNLLESPYVEDAISYYQYASHLLASGQYSLKP